MITEFISQYVSVTNLGAIVSLFIGVLLPVAILLLETVTDNVIDRAVILKDVVNLKKVLFGLGLIALCFLSWKIKLIRPVFFVLYLVGLAILIMVLLRAVSWISDWSESSPDGVRYKWRRQILSDKKIDEDKRLKLWEVYLDSFKKQNKDHMGLSTNLVTGEQFLDFFKSYYEDSKIDKFVLLTSISNHLDSIFSFPRSYEGKFLKLGLSELSKLKDHPEVMFAWKSLIQEECHLVVHNDLRTHIFLEAVQELTPKQATKENSSFYRTLAQLICDVIWEQNQKFQDDDLLANSVWRISSNNISLDNPPGAAQTALLNAFWQKVDQVKTKAALENNSFKTGMRLDSLVRTIFSEADPLVLGQLYEIFQIRPIPSFESDWSKSVFDMFDGHPLFGYIPRGTAVWSVQKEDSKEDEKAANTFLLSSYGSRSEKALKL